MQYIYILILGFSLLISTCSFGQNTLPKLYISAQTDLLAYTTKGGFSIWGVARHGQNQVSLAFVNYPNRDKSFNEGSGLQENDRFIRIGLVRYWNKRKLKYLFYGVNIEYHWRELTEDGSPERLDDTHFDFAPIVGYHWYPWINKENTLRNLSIMPWAGPRLRPNYYKQDRVFEQTGSVYPIPSFIDLSFGVNVSYTFFRK